MAVASRSEHNLRFIPISLALFAVGIVQRYQSSWLVLDARQILAFCKGVTRPAPVAFSCAAFR